MTVCIAAIALDVIDSDNGTCQQPMILCSDKRIEGWNGGADIMQKQLWAGERWPALIAGDDISRATDLLAMYRDHLNTIGPQTEQSIIETLKFPARQMRRTLIDNYIELNTGLNYEEFLRVGSQPNPPEYYHRVSGELKQVELGCELLIVGYIGWHPKIFHVRRDASVAQQQHFCAIGSGGTVAEATLFRRKYDWNVKKNQAMYLAYEAKKFSEVMPGAGSETEISIVRWWGDDKPLSVHSIDCEGEMDEHFRKYGPQPLPREDFHDLPPYCFTEW